MRDVEIYTAVRAALLAGFEGWPFGPVEVLQRTQTATVGAETGPVVYMQIIGAYRYGSPSRSEIWDAELGEFIHREVQKMETTVQLSALYRDGADEATAADVAQMAAMIVNGLPAMTSLRAAGAGVLRATQVRNPPFTNGQDTVEYDPNFDLVLTHEQTTLTRTPGAVATDLRVVSV